MTNFGKQLFSTLKDKCVGVSKLLRMSCSTVRKGCFVKFDHFFRNWSFVTQVSRYLFEKFIGTGTPKYPIQLRMATGLLVYPADGSPKSGFEPVKHRVFGVVKSHNRFEDGIGFSFGDVSLNGNATFSVDKTGNIDQVLLRMNEISRKISKRCQMITGNKIFFLKFSHLINNWPPLESAVCVEKGKKCSAFFLSLNQIGEKLLSYIPGCLSFDCPSAPRFLFIGNARSYVHIAANLLLKVIENTVIRGRNDKSSLNFFALMGNIKAAISVGVTGKINKGVFVHAYSV